MARLLLLLSLVPLLLLLSLVPLLLLLSLVPLPCPRAMLETCGFTGRELADRDQPRAGAARRGQVVRSRRLDFAAGCPGKPGRELTGYAGAGERP